jgi:histone deacetylase 6
MKVILGEPPDELPPMEASESATETIWQVGLQQSRYWKSVDPKACEPREGKRSHFLSLETMADGFQKSSQ